jgi:hypothetical protein
MSRNESLLIAASYFWSDALNAFLFGHGPMAPTLADVLVLTGLDISSPDTLFSHRNDKLSHQLKTKHIGRWSGYFTEHKKEGTAGQREHVAFLNMWLEKFVFCGKNFSPTANYHIVAEWLAAGNRIPLRIYLLGVLSPNGVQILRRQCMNFGEVVSVFQGHKRTPSRIEEHFRSFYLGFNSNSII